MFVSFQRAAIVRTIVLVTVAAAMSACAAVPTADKAVKQYHISNVDVLVTPEAHVEWPGVAAEYVASIGMKAPKNTATQDRETGAPSTGDTRQDEAYSAALRSPASRKLQVARARTVMKKAMTTHTKGALAGSKPAIMRVTLRQVDISSAGGRALLGTTSTVVGDVAIVDQATGEIVAQKGGIRVEDKGAGGSGNVGILVAVAYNIATAAQDQYMEKLSDKFAVHTRTWLGGT